MKKAKKKVNESIVNWTLDVGECTSQELKDAVLEQLKKRGYTFGGSVLKKPVCKPKTYYSGTTSFNGQVLFMCSVKGEYYDEIIIQVNDSPVFGMANYMIRSPEGVMWMGQSTKELDDDIGDMTTGYNEF